MGWCTHVSADKRDISFWIFSPTEAWKVPTQRTPKSNQNQRVSIKKTNIRISPRWAPTKKTNLSSTQGIQTIIFRQRNRGAKILKSYPLHRHTRHTRQIKGQSWIKNMTENNKTTLYALRYAKGARGDVRMWVPTKGTFLFGFLTHWSVERTNTAHTKIRSEPNS